MDGRGIPNLGRNADNERTGPARMRMCGSARPLLLIPRLEKQRGERGELAKLGGSEEREGLRKRKIGSKGNPREGVRSVVTPPNLLSQTDLWRLAKWSGRVHARMIGLQSTALLQQRPTRW